MSLRQTFQFECRCCRQPWDQKEIPDAAITAVIFGQPYLYAICPNCLQRVTRGDAKDANYRRRYRRVLEKRGMVQRCPEDGRFAFHRDRGLISAQCEGVGKLAPKPRKEKSP